MKKFLIFIISVFLIAIVFGLNRLNEVKAECESSQKEICKETVIINTIEGCGSPRVRDYKNECVGACEPDKCRFSCIPKADRSVVTMTCEYPREKVENSVWRGTVSCECKPINLPSSAPTLFDQLAEELGLVNISTVGVFSKASIDKIVQFILLFLMGILSLLFVILLIIAGIKYMTAGEDENKRKVSIKRIISAVIGLIIVLSSFLILSIFFSFFGISPFKKGERLIPVECEGLSGEAFQRCIELFGEEEK